MKLDMKLLQRSLWSLKKGHSFHVAKYRPHTGQVGIGILLTPEEMQMTLNSKDRLQVISNKISNT